MMSIFRFGWRAAGAGKLRRPKGSSFFLVPIAVTLGAVASVVACGSPGLGIDGPLNHGGSSSSSGLTGGQGGTGGGGPILYILDGGDNDADLGDATSYGLCVPRTCLELGASCGPQGDGCGHEIQCGNCKAPQTCGGAGVPNQCGGDNNCQPKTCADWGANCGPVADGCGSLLQCGGCTAPETCGGGDPDGGAKANVCGGNGACVPKTCTDMKVKCGPSGDGCGGLLQCGTCTTPESCGGGGVPSVCGAPPVTDGGLTCVPRNCGQAGFNCGPAGDGCGGRLDCGTCKAPSTCGGGGQPGVCGGSAGCVPRSSCGAIQCGPAGDGCGGQLTCGTCTAPATCGGGLPDAGVDAGGAQPGVCGGNNNCIPTTCAAVGASCGPVGDGCGGLLQCGSTCPTGQICGGGGLPNVCGPTDAGVSCTGLCQKQVTCAGKNVTTTISGTVYAPNSTDPVYNALVYIPNSAVAPFTTGITCDQCANSVSGSPLVSANTAADGTFQLQNVPVGTNIPLVIQLGRWRRQLTIPSTASCGDTHVDRLNAKKADGGVCVALGAACGVASDCCSNSCTKGVCDHLTRLPKNQSEGDIPLTAMITGNADALECVFRKIGLDDSEFTTPAAGGPLDAGVLPDGGPTAGRIQFYMSNGANSPTGDAPSQTVLFADQATLNAYDMVILSCVGDAKLSTTHNLADPTASAGPDGGGNDSKLITYTSLGGRVFTTHYSYVWLYNDPPFQSTATWANASDPSNQAGYVDFTNPKGQAFAQWLQIVGASTTYGQVPLIVLRNNMSAVNSSLAQQWLYRSGPSPMHYTFNTPVGAAQQCGRVLYSDFHVWDANNDTTMKFPVECTQSGPMNAQEHLLEFMLFDLASCITPTTPPTPPSCTPLTCTGKCGLQGDGCGNPLNCGGCPVGQTCGGGGVPNQCGGATCSPLTCAQQGIGCGVAGDGCGNLIHCAVCPNGQTCGGGGVPNQCGAPPCTPVTCSTQHIQCGYAGNGCGGLLSCGACPAGEVCGGAGVPGQCAGADSGTCNTLTCGAQHIGCGPAGDGCGGQLDCGTCPVGQTCGGGGVPGQCGATPCIPVTCTELLLECGPAGDGCGGVIQCGDCPPNETCGGGGQPGICGTDCRPTTCTALGYTCGPAGDGCGNLLNCGTCVFPDTCGGAGISGHCGHSGIH